MINKWKRALLFVGTVASVGGVSTVVVSCGTTKDDKAQGTQQPASQQPASQQPASQQQVAPEKTAADFFQGIGGASATLASIEAYLKSQGFETQYQGKPAPVTAKYNSFGNRYNQYQEIMDWAKSDDHTWANLKRIGETADSAHHHGQAMMDVLRANNYDVPKSLSEHQ